MQVTLDVTGFVMQVTLDVTGFVMQVTLDVTGFVMAAVSLYVNSTSSYTQIFIAKRCT